MHEFVFMICKSRGKYFPILNLDITFIKLAVFGFLRSENDIIYTVTLRHLSLFGRVIVR